MTETVIPLLLLVFMLGSLMAVEINNAKYRRNKLPAASTDMRVAHKIPDPELERLKKLRGEK